MSPRRISLVSLLVFVAIVIIGSLSPFELNPQADWRLVLQGPEHSILPASRSDFVANCLLLMPIGFLLVPACTGGTWRRTLVTLLFYLSALLLMSIVLESLQRLSLNRTSACSDVMAQAIGAMGGITISIALRSALYWRVSGDGNSMNEKLSVLLSAYTLGCLFVTFLPFSFSISPAEIYGQWKQGNIALVDSSWSSAGLVRHALTYVLSSIPIGSWLVLMLGPPYERTLRKAIGWNVIGGACFFSFAVTAAQTFLRGQVVTLLGAGSLFIGIILGAHLFQWLLYHHLLRLNSNDETPWTVAAKSVWLAALVGCLVYLGLEHVWTEEPLLLGANAFGRLQAMIRSPFDTMTNASMLSLLDNVIRKTVTWMPLGATAWGIHRSSTATTKLPLRPIGLIVATAIMIEVLQSATVDHVPDFSDVILYMSGAFSGAYLLETVFRWQLSADETRE